MNWSCDATASVRESGEYLQRTRRLRRIAQNCARIAPELRGRVLELGDLLHAVVKRQPRARVVGAAAERDEAPRLQRGLVTPEDEDRSLVRPHREPRAIGAERELRRGARDAARLEPVSYTHLTLPTKRIV